jgi:hypothetical protein
MKLGVIIGSLIGATIMTAMLVSPETVSAVGAIFGPVLFALGMVSLAGLAGGLFGAAVVDFLKWRRG